MNIPSPAKVAANRTARLVSEYRTPVYSTDSTTAKRDADRDLYVRAQALAVTEDFCHVCGRATDHFAEHTPEQILAWAKRPGLLQSAL